MGQGVLAGYWVAGAFASLAYFDQYWCVLFIFEAARRLVAREIASPASALGGAPSIRVPQIGIGAGALTKSDERNGYAKSRW